jgi:hypothetical protein
MIGNVPMHMNFGKKCKPAEGMPYRGSTPSSDDDIPTLLDKIDNAAGVEDKSIKWRRSFNHVDSWMFSSSSGSSSPPVNYLIGQNSIYVYLYLWDYGIFISAITVITSLKRPNIMSKNRPNF